MGNICCFFCRRPRYDKYDVPDNCEEHKGHPSSRGSSYDVINDYHMINGYHIINLEIRYKGQIRPEPQFQAVITPQFTKLVKGEGQPDPRY